MSALAFQFEYSLWLLLPVLLVSVAIAYLLYLNKKNDFTSPIKWVLFSIRFIIVVILGVLLLNVFFLSKEKQLQKPILVVAVDESESILHASTDSTEIRNEIENFVQNIQTNLSETYQIDFIGFSMDVNENPEFVFHGKRTNLGRFLSYVQDKYYMLPLEDMIVVTDGQVNQGTHPQYLLENSTYQIYPVIVGDTGQYANLQIDDIYYNRVVRQNSVFPVDVVIQSSGFKGKQAELIVKSNNQIVARQEISFSSDDESKELRFNIKASQSGLQKFEVEISSAVEEINKLNNTAEFYIQVVESGEKILIIGHHPHPDLGAISSALKLVDGLQVDVKTLNDYPFSIKDYSLVILHGLPSSDERSKLLLSLPEMQSKAIWYIWTTSSQLNDSSFPYEIKQTNTFEYAEPSPVTDFDDFTLPYNWGEAFSYYPPLYTPFATMDAQKQTSNLFTQKIRGYESGEPLWSFWTDKGVRRSLLAGEGIWKWKLYNYQMEANHQIFNDLIQRVGKYLLTGSYQDRFNLTYQNSYSETDLIILDAQVLNKAFENVNNAEVSFKLIDEQKNEYPYQFSAINDRYILELGFLKGGMYTFQAQAKLADTLLKEQGQFTVDSWNEEVSRTGANMQLIKEISVNSDGQYYTLLTSSNIISKLKDQQSEVIRYTYIQKVLKLIDVKSLLLLVLLLLSIEWFLRKYFGRY